MQANLSFPKYRPDIDGLRAIAVLAIVTFHAFPNWIKGGFIGVDIFFVISGYLISINIFGDLEKDTFSFSEFYARRIRRIFPALILILVTCFIVGWFTLLADEYKYLGKHIAAGAGFIPNIIFWNETGYFDASADTKPLLHLWSLGVEEQFYITWPLLLWLFWRRKFNLFTIILLITLISFSLNIKGVKSDAVATFYSPQTRFWELLSGSLLAWLTLYGKNSLSSARNTILLQRLLKFLPLHSNQDIVDKKIANILSFVSLFLLALAIFRFGKELAFPGWAALVPVLCTICLISAGPSSWINRIILSHKLLVWFGLISFPLYLWHWPLLTFARIVEDGVPSLNIRLFVIICSTALAWLTYQLVERPIRFGRHRKFKVAALVVLLSIVGFAGYNAFKRDGLNFRLNKFNEKNQIILSEFKYSLSLGRPENAHIMLIGDSHATHLSTGLKLNFDQLISDYTETGCIPFFNVDRFDSRGAPGACLKFMSESLSLLEQTDKFKSVIISSMGPIYLEGTGVFDPFDARITGQGVILSNRSDIMDKYKVYEIAMRETLIRLFKVQKKVLFVIDVPELDFHPRNCFDLRPVVIRSNKRKVCAISRADYDKRNYKFKEMIYSIAKEFPELMIYDPTNDFCDANYCYGSKDGILLYRDPDHLSGSGSNFLIQKMIPQLEMLR
jgi:peptidoglycan/LPS O-acetylase OafA/YrhL